ncbi:CaiB/BaiF CoA transferase family protein [Nakamurella sp. GG22]
MSTGLPLEGVRVVEFSHMVMGPTCGLILADLGADVIKVEPMGGGDKTRGLGGSGAGYFPMFNRNKRSLTVDLKSEQGIAFVKRLVAGADVVTENFRPGGLDGMGLGYRDLKVDNPGLVYCSLKGFLSGPYEQRAALDEVVQTMGGLTYMTGPPGQPLRAGTSVNDIMGGLFAAIGIMAALHQRTTTGTGQLVRSSLFENNVFLVGQHMAQYGVTGVPAAPMPVRESAWAVYDLFDTADDEKIFVGVVSDTQWAAFCLAFDLRDLVGDPQYATNAGRVKARDTLLPLLREQFRSRTRDEASRLLESARLPFAPLQRPEDLFDDPHLAMPGAMTELTLPGGRTLPLPALPLEMDGRRLAKRLDLPRPGEHSQSIARDLGYTDEAIEQLQDAGVLGIDQQETVTVG